MMDIVTIDILTPIVVYAFCSEYKRVNCYHLMDHGAVYYYREQAGPVMLEDFVQDLPNFTGLCYRIRQKSCKYPLKSTSTVKSC